MDKILENQIMTHKWHEFLYAYDTNERSKFLKDMEEHYPIVYGNDVPMGIFLETYGINVNEENEKSIDQGKAILLDVTAREYLKNLIAYHIISRIESNSNVMGQVGLEIIKFLNSSFFNRKQKISSIKNYLSELKDTLSIWKDNYDSVLINGITHHKLYEFSSDFPNILRFGEMLKKILNNNDQFNIIIDYKEKTTIQSCKAIMSIVNSRCPGTICMKVATDPEKWPTYYDLNECLVEELHDYTYRELDDSNQKLLEKSMSKFM